MKNWIKSNWNTFIVGYAAGIVFMTVMDLIDSIIIKIAILVMEN